MENKLYIILSNTKTRFKELAYLVTNEHFNHISISLDSKLNEMYTFDLKLNGFKIENKDNFPIDANCLVYSTIISDKQKNELSSLLKSKIIKKIPYSKKQLLESIITVTLNRININIKTKTIDEKEKGFTCASFVDFILKNYTNNFIDISNIYNPNEYKGKYKFEFKGLWKNINLK